MFGGTLSRQEAIQELRSALATDGEDHKQWSIERALALLGDGVWVDENSGVTYDEGVCP